MSDYVEVYDLRSNMLRKALIVGKTGTGKSSLCNAMAGLPFNSTLFPVSPEATSCTQNTTFANVHFGGDKERLISLIDTMGFDDPNNDTDVKIIAELVDKLMNNCDKVNLFLIAVNGQNPRLDGSLVAMIKIFQEMFSDAFWKQCCLVFTRMPMDKKSIKKRLKSTEGISDDKLAQNYIKAVEDKFPQVKNKGLKYVFMDACFDEEDEDEANAFQEALDKVYELLESFEGLPSNQINKEVETEHKKLKRELNAREKEKQEYVKKLEVINGQLKEAEMERKKSEDHYQNEKARLENLIHEGQKDNQMVKGQLEVIQGQLVEAKANRDRDERAFEQIKANMNSQIDSLKEACKRNRGGGFWGTLVSFIPIVGPVVDLIKRIK